MKLINIIKLLSVLLCIFALFAACDSKETTTTATVETTEQITTETETEEETRGEVEPVLDNFFTFSEVDSWIELGDATRLDGTCVSKTYNNEIIVLRSAEIDTMNVVTETFTVYNTILEKAVLTLKNTYDYDHYSAFDWNDIYVNDESVKYPASVMKVEALSVGSTFVIKVSKAAVTPTEEATLEENENANYYTINVSCEFYDVTGTKIVDTKYDVMPQRARAMSGNGMECLAIANTYAFFDTSSMELVKTINSNNQATIAGYDYETEKYGYFFGYHSIALGTRVNYVEVYNKATSAHIFTRFFDLADSVSAFVLENGNIFVQAINEIEADIPYNFESDGNKYTLDSYILDVKKNNMTAIECDYIISNLTFVNEDAIESMESEGIKITDNVDNVALVYTIKDGKADRYPQVAVIDNRFNVLFVLDRIVPEHNVTLNNGFGFEIIAEGNYLVELHNVVTSRAIVSKDGKVRCYLNANDVVVDKYVVNEYGIFDFDMNLLYDFEANSLSFTTVVGNKIIVSELVEVYEEIEEETENDNILFPEDKPNDTEGETFEGETEVITEEETEEEATPIEVYVKYYVINFDEEGNISYKKIYNENDRMDFVASMSGSSYVVFKSQKTGKYSLYNSELGHVLTTHYPMNVYRCDDKFIVSTQLPVDGEIIDIFYTIAISIEE